MDTITATTVVVCVFVLVFVLVFLVGKRPAATDEIRQSLAERLSPMTPNPYESPRETPYRRSVLLLRGAVELSQLSWQLPSCVAAGFSSLALLDILHDPVILLGPFSGATLGFFGGLIWPFR